MTQNSTGKRKRPNGHLVSIGGKPYFRVRIAGRRPAIPIACEKDEIDTRVKILRGIVKRVRAADKLDLLEPWLRDAGQAESAEKLEAVLRIVDDVCADRKKISPLLHPSMTYSDLFELFHSGKLSEMFPNHVKPLKEATQKSYRSFYENHIKAVVGHLPIGGITIDHGLEILAGVPGEGQGALRYNIATVLMRPLSIAVFPGRVLAQSPFPRGFRPRMGRRRAMAMFHPKEDAAYLACEEIALVERLMTGLLNREGLRVSELTKAQVKSFDPETGWFTLDENKTGQPRSWVLREDCAEALRRYLAHYRRNPKGDDWLLVQGEECRNAGKRVVRNASGVRLRENAQKAGLKRAQLWEESKVRRHLTTHDTRATFITISLAEGKSESWITDRTGHTSSEMLYRYKREARNYAEAKLGSLLPLHECIPELRKLGPSDVVGAGRPDAEGESEGGQSGRGAATEVVGERPAGQWTQEWTVNSDEGKTTGTILEADFDGCESNVRSGIMVLDYVSPALDGARVQRGARVVRACGERDYSGKPDHLLWSVCVIGRPVTKLAHAAVPPALHGAQVE